METGIGNLVLLLLLPLPLPLPLPPPPPLLDGGAPHRDSQIPGTTPGGLFHTLDMYSLPLIH